METNPNRTNSTPNPDAAEWENIGAEAQPEETKFETPETQDVKAEIFERPLPDGTMFRGTAEEWQQELQDYRDRIGA